jgi:hypothetical protein
MAYLAQAGLDVFGMDITGFGPSTWPTANAVAGSGLPLKRGLVQIAKETAWIGC